MSNLGSGLASGSVFDARDRARWELTYAKGAYTQRTRRARRPRCL